MRSVATTASALELGRLRLEAAARSAANPSAAGAARVRVAGREAPQGGVLPRVEALPAPPGAAAQSVEQLAAARHVSLLRKALRIQQDMVGVLLDLRA